MTVVPSKFERKANDLYETEEWATRALLRHLDVAGVRVWEPAAGNHKIVDVLRAVGAGPVIATDIVTYDREHFCEWDFFKTCDADADAIITNPPYGKGNREATRFAELALERTNGWVALLLTAKWDFGKTRLHLTRDNPRYHAKIALVDRIQWFPGATTGTEDHAWFIWRPTTDPVWAPVALYEGKKAA